MTENVKTNFISQAWLVLFLAICFGALLAGMQITLGPPSKPTRSTKPWRRSRKWCSGGPCQELAPGSKSWTMTPISVGVEKAGKTVRYNVYEAKSDGQLAGWVVKTAGQGYADKIEMLIGFDPTMEKLPGYSCSTRKKRPVWATRSSPTNGAASFWPNPRPGPGNRERPSLGRQ
jgi:electron transport complex protein RnfG